MAPSCATPSIDERVARIAAGRHGVVTHAQFLGAGLSPDRVDGRVRSRRTSESDRRRDARPAAQGILVVRVTWRQIADEPDAVPVRLAQTLARAEPGDPLRM
ncbi:MAG TPA: hypothetical protein VF188_06940 [Longimicrobiales bacterium]